MQMFLVDVVNGKAGAIEVEPKLENYYNLLNCNTIDITSRQLDGTYFDIICDDEGLLCDSPIASAIDGKRGGQLVGNLLFCHHNGDGDETGLTPEDVKLIENHLGCYVRSDCNKPTPIIVELEY